jgi:hypothetical protein
MNLFRTVFFITAVAVAVAIAPAALAGNPTPSELKALEIRGQALNQQCGDPTLSREAFRALCGNAGAQNQPTRAELKALEIRGQALNHLCDGTNIASVAGFRAVCGSSAQIVTLPAPEVPSSSGFDWGDFGIGVAAMFGLVLLAMGFLAGAHYRRKGSVRPRPVS